MYDSFDLDEGLDLEDSQDVEELLGVDEFVDLDEDLDGLRDSLDRETLEALQRGPEQRSARDVELVDAALHPDYETQKIFEIDPDTGRALRNEHGEFVTSARRGRGTQVPDGFLEDHEGVHLREAKLPETNNRYALWQNMKAQTADRRQAFGDDVDLTYVVGVNGLTIADAEYLQQRCQQDGVDIDWQY